MRRLSSGTIFALGVSGTSLEGTYEEEDTFMTNVEEDTYLGGLGRGIRGHI
jgi:phage repressor protein C with HTH and peptisase S24 domain